MASDAFLQFTKAGPNAPPIVGESNDGTYGLNGSVTKAAAAFELDKWGVSVSNTATIGSGNTGAVAGKAEFDAFTVTKKMDIATPSLFQTGCLGGHYTLVTLWIRKAGGSGASAGVAYLQFTFMSVFVESIKWSGSEDAPTEDISFRYGAVQIIYTPQNNDGSMNTKGQKIQDWSQQLNSDGNSFS